MFFFLCKNVEHDWQPQEPELRDRDYIMSDLNRFWPNPQFSLSLTLSPSPSRYIKKFWPKAELTLFGSSRYFNHLLFQCHIYTLNINGLNLEKLGARGNIHIIDISYKYMAAIEQIYALNILRYVSISATDLHSVTLTWTSASPSETFQPGAPSFHHQDPSITDLLCLCLCLRHCLCLFIWLVFL